MNPDWIQKTSGSKRHLRRYFGDNWRKLNVGWEFDDIRELELIFLSDNCGYECVSEDTFADWRDELS